MHQPPQSPQALAQAEKARKLVNLSHILGYGGLGFLFVLTPLLGVATHSGILAGAMAVIGILAAIGGAIVGQVGRAMQGRVI